MKRVAAGEAASPHQTFAPGPIATPAKALIGRKIFGQMPAGLIVSRSKILKGHLPATRLAFRPLAKYATHQGFLIRGF
jgi:hypothetical protein